MQKDTPLYTYATVNECCSYKYQKRGEGDRSRLGKKAFLPRQKTRLSKAKALH